MPDPPFQPQIDEILREKLFDIMDSMFSEPRPFPPVASSTRVFNDNNEYDTSHHKVRHMGKNDLSTGKVPHSSIRILRIILHRGYGHYFSGGVCGFPPPQNLYQFGYYNDVPVGVVTLEPESRTSSNYWITHLTVLPTYRQHGVATMLLYRILEVASRRNATKVSLYVPMRTPWFVKFCTGFGFYIKTQCIAGATLKHLKSNLLFCMELYMDNCAYINDIPKSPPKPKPTIRTGKKATDFLPIILCGDD